MDNEEQAGETGEKWTSWQNPVATPERWLEVRRAVEAGMSQKEASEVFNVSYDAIRQRANREEWLTEARVAAKKAELVTKQSQGAETALEAVAVSLEGYRSQTLLSLAKLAKKGVETAVAAQLPVENWQDAKIAAEIAMKLHQVGSEAVQVNICNAFADMDEGKLIETDAEEIENGDSRDSYFIDAE